MPKIDLDKVVRKQGSSYPAPFDEPCRARVVQSDAVARFLVVGSRDDDDRGEYADIDMTFETGRYSDGKGGIFRRKDGTPY